MTKEEIQKAKINAKIFWLKECVKDAERELQNIELLEEFEKFKTNSKTSKECTKTLIENLKKDLAARQKIVQNASTAQETQIH